LNGFQAQDVRWPRFDSAPCFAALLGSRDTGRWLVDATDPKARIRRRYRDNTPILETAIEGADGAATVVDFMFRHRAGEDCAGGPGRRAFAHRRGQEQSGDTLRIPGYSQDAPTYNARGDALAGRLR
jgi:GH15 family glucan-1,4-alpha-glucosidase